MSNTLAELNGANHANGANGINVNEHHQTHGLRVLVVGAGIAGLSAAIGLRKQGHQVEVGYCQSRVPRMLS